MKAPCLTYPPREGNLYKIENSGWIQPDFEHINYERKHHVISGSIEPDFAAASFFGLSAFFFVQNNKPTTREMTKPLHFWSLTVANNHKPLLNADDFDSVCTQFGKQWCYQGEYGSNKQKPHYQVRIIVDPPQTKATLLHCFSMRGMDINDITFKPESNKSIEQGGLSFYVMDSTKDVWLPMRCDPSYKLPKSPNWVPSMCQIIVDTPRPWQVKVLEMLQGEPHHRQIIWICTLNGLGGVQKSLFTTYLEAIGKALYVGDGTPIQLKEAVISEGEQSAYTMDLPKTFAADNRIGDYINVIETIKNGFLKTAMHGKRKRLMMDKRPHVLVFSNRTPPYDAMTEGRFMTFTINPNKPAMFQTLDPYVPPAQD